MVSDTTFVNRQLTEEEYPSIEEVDFIKHPKRYRSYILLTSLGPLMFILPAWLVLLIVGLKFWGLGLFIAWVLVCSAIILEEVKSFPIRGYALREKDITYRKGWLFFSKITVPFNRIQHCEIAQGPLAQLYDLSELRIYTAGGAASDLSIGGLNPDDAHRLREYIAKAASIYE